MTGYGRGEYKNGGIELTVEIKTVNNRYLDSSVKAPRILTAHEETIRAVLREKLTRGHADVFVSLSDKREREKKLYLDEDTAKSYVAAAAKIKSLFPGIQDDISVSGVLRYPDVIKSEDVATADEEILTALKSALSAALEKLNAMREVEGKKLEEDMLSRMQTIENLVGEVEKRAPAVATNYRQKLSADELFTADFAELRNMGMKARKLFVDVAFVGEESRFGQ